MSLAGIIFVAAMTVVARIIMVMAMLVVMSSECRVEVRAIPMSGGLGTAVNVAE